MIDHPDVTVTTSDDGTTCVHVTLDPEHVRRAVETVLKHRFANITTRLWAQYLTTSELDQPRKAEIRARIKSLVDEVAADPAVILAHTVELTLDEADDLRDNLTAATDPDRQKD